MQTTDSPDTALPDDDIRLAHASRRRSAHARLMARRVSLAIASHLLNGVSWGLRLLPGSVRYLPADVVTLPVSYLLAGKVRVARANYATALGLDVADPKIRRLARRSIRNYGRMAIDFLAARTASGAELAARMATVGYEHYADAISDQRGVIFALPHLGSWDVAAVLAEVYSAKLTIVTESDWVTELVAGARVGHGVTLVPRDRSLRALFRALARKEAVVLLADIANGGVQTIDVPFFGKPAPFPVGPARLALRTQAPIVVVYCVRRPDRTYLMEAQAPLRADPARSEDENVEALTTAMAAGFARIIAAHPEHWYPYHPMWDNMLPNIPLIQDQRADT
ncbi:MAG TPA: lysophospholipid acyltransferase family protein [Ktedonobacterales bacterium]|nr:lysophospholipid acyltransferase family protein [Ktedonobacterales bacterium]